MHDRSRIMAALLALVFGLGLGARATLAQVPGGSAGSWLDRPLSGWNSAGMAIPQAPAANASGNDSFCAGQQRPPETASDVQLASAGWRLFGVYEGGWGVQVVGAQSDEDGMCRPTGYQYFVFVNGTFAGTIAPVPMDSRTDGAGGRPFISGAGTQLTANFTRYTATDPLCCPSSSTEVTYHIDTSGGSPVLVPDKASTTANS
jgi:hypothetical protein